MKDHFPNIKRLALVYSMHTLRFIIYTMLFSITYSAGSPVGIVLMVKNEEGSIGATIQPFIDAGVDSFLIFDTGSADNTIAHAQALFTSHKIQHYHITQEPFIDFAQSRNHALDRAQQLLPHCTFLLMPDAEWYIQGIHELIDFCAQEAAQHTPLPDYYAVRITDGTIDFYTPRLIPRTSTSRFTEPAHEALTYSGRSKKVPATSYFEYKPSSIGKQKTKKRLLQDKRQLLRAHRKDRTNPRILFYLAQTYDCLGDYHNAYRYYKKRARLGGPPEETYMAWYRLAQVTQKRGRRCTQNWREACQYYQIAHSLRPHRIEPLIRIAEYYQEQNDPVQAQEYAKKTLTTPYPHTDCMFIERADYTQKRYALAQTPIPGT